MRSCRLPAFSARAIALLALLCLTPASVQAWVVEAFFGTIYEYTEGNEDGSDYTYWSTDQYTVTLPSLSEVRILGAYLDWYRVGEGAQWGFWGSGQYTNLGQFSPGSYTFEVGRAFPGNYNFYVEYLPLEPPQASFSATPASGRSPLNVSFNGSSSTASQGSIVSYEWDFQSDGSFDASGVTASHSYANNGSTAQTSTVRLKVTSSNGQDGSASQIITVYPPGSYALSVQNGTGSSPPGSYYLPASAAAISGSSPLPTQPFAGWTLVSGSGTFANASSVNTTFSGTSDSVVRANFAPTAPGNLVSPSHTASSISLGWTASVDDVAVTAYDVYRTRAGVTHLLASVIAPTVSYTDISISADTPYSYHIKARDGAGNISMASNTLSVTAAAGSGIPDSLQALLGGSSPASDSSLGLKPHRPSP